MLPLPELVDTGIGGGFINGFGPSTVTFTATTLNNNVAQGGNGAAGSPGGDAIGGGLVNTTGGTATLTACTLANNQVRGGQGGAGSNGGNATGGGIIDGTFGDTNPTANPFGPASATLIACLVTNNQAQGGDAGSGGVGGDAFGGGLFVGPADTLNLTACIVTNNQAQGGGGGGIGEGGGVYNFNPVGFTFLATIIAHNHASTAYDDIFSL